MWPLTEEGRPGNQREAFLALIEWPLVTRAGREREERNGEE